MRFAASTLLAIMALLISGTVVSHAAVDLDPASTGFTFGGNATWFLQSAVSHDGIDAYQSGSISNSQSSWMETTVIGPGAVRYFWKVSSEPYCDPLSFSIDGVNQTDIRGEIDWQKRAFAVPAGSHTVRWTYSTDGSVLSGSNAGWVDEITFEAGDNIDVTPPVTTPTPAGGMYASNQSVALYCTDNVGCSGTFYCLGTGCNPSIPYSARILVNSPTVLRFYSTDSVGNNELVNTASYTFDTTPPTTSTSVPAGTYSGARNVTLYCGDSGLGCAATYYCLGSGCTPTNIYSSPIAINGSTDLRYYSTDRAGNSAAVKTATYTITPDTTPPVTTPNHPSGTYGPSYVYFSCSDGNGSGCAATYYCLGAGCTPSAIFSTSVHITASTDLRFYSQDNSGNSEDVQSVSYVIDQTSPVTTANPPGGSYESAPQVTLSCNDASGTGCSITYYCQGEGCNPSIQYRNPVPINDSTVLRFYSVDNAQNNEIVVTQNYVNPAQPKTITVPGMHSTIQSAIDIAYNGDTVQVAPGTYVENINFKGKAITVVSSGGADVTTIDGNHAGTVVTFSSEEGPFSILDGFTISNGSAWSSPNYGDGGGIYISYASPMIINNRIIANSASWGGGVCVRSGAPLIRDNIISQNTSSSYGGGIVLFGVESAEITHNVISGNSSDDGGGISMWGVGTPLISNNSIVNNTAVTNGGGIDMVNDNNSRIVQNLIAENHALNGGGIHWSISSSAPGLSVVNNTIFNNDATIGSGVFVDGFDANAVLTNNIIVAKSGQAAMHCDGLYDNLAPQLYSNVVFTPSGDAYSGICTDQNGINSNITADPRLSSPQLGYYGPLPGSPAIDAGDGTAPLLPATDFGGMSRVADGNGDGTTVVDIGAYEFALGYPVAELQGIPTDFLRVDYLDVTVGGTDVVSYRYALDGGAFTTADTLVATPISLSGLANGQHSIVVLGKNSLGNEQLLSSATAATWVVNTETTNLTFSSGGTAPWYEQATVTRDGIAYQSGAISNSESSWLETRVTGPGALRFWWKVSSSGWSDSLRLTIDGISKDSISGDIDWQSKAYVIPAGNHIILWSYSTDDNWLGGSNAGWLDRITYEAGSNFDVTAPVTTATPASGMYGSGQSVALACSDGSGSGCTETFYCLGSGCNPTIPYSGAITISSTTALRFYSTDTAGNYETIKTATYSFDTTPPTTSTGIPAGTYSGARNVTLYCGDSGLGCAATYYCLGSGCNPAVLYSTAIAINASTDLRYYSTDRAGNSEAIKTGSYIITQDATPPITTPSYPSGTYGTINVYLSCNDGIGSGCASTYYCLGTGCTPTTSFTGGINITTSTDFRFYSRDNAGNRETIKTVSYAIDTTPPTTTASIAGGRYPHAQSVSLACSDSGGTGCSTTYYCLGSGCTPVTNYSEPILVSFSTDLSFFSRDNARQQETIKTVSYTITDAVAPTTAALPSGGSFAANQQVSLICDDGTGSGCAETQYCLGSGCIPDLQYIGPITIAASTVLRFSSLDFGGNIEVTKSATYQISADTPTTSANPAGGTYFSPQSVTLTCHDSTTVNCAATYYCLEAGCTPTTPYSGPIDIIASSELRFYSQGSAGNSEAIRSAIYNVIALPAEGVSIAAPNRVDMVYDSNRDILYITSGSQILRYRLATGAFLTPFDFGTGRLSGLDLSPDGNTLAIADRDLTGIHLVDLSTGTIKPDITFSPASGEGGSYTVAFGNDGALLVTTDYNGSGWTPLRRVDPQTGAVTIIAKNSFPDNVTQSTMLSASAGGSCIGYAESNSSAGPLGIYDVATRRITRFLQIPDGTGAYNYEIGTNRDCTQFAVPTYHGTFIYDNDLAKKGTIGVYAGGRPIGAVYHPLKDVAYFAWSGTSEVRGYSKNFAQIASFDVGYTFQNNVNYAFDQGRLKISRDGSLLFATVTGGIYCQYMGSSTPIALNQTVNINSGFPRGITLTGRGSSLSEPTYTIVTSPSHGSLQGTAPNLIYTPEASFVGVDEIEFKINDGNMDSNIAIITINVVPLPASGDLTKDGIVSIADALWALQMTVGLIVPAGDDLMVGDVAPLGTDGRPTPDGTIDIRDTLLILKKVMGLVSW